MAAMSEGWLEGRRKKPGMFLLLLLHQVSLAEVLSFPWLCLLSAFMVLTLPGWHQSLDSDENLHFSFLSRPSGEGDFLSVIICAPWWADWFAKGYKPIPFCHAPSTLDRMTSCLAGTKMAVLLRLRNCVRTFLSRVGSFWIRPEFYIGDQRPSNYITHSSSDWKERGVRFTYPFHPSWSGKQEGPQSSVF